jgi:aspartate 1-decarboxylase
MLLTLLKCKIHRASVTHSDLDYEGSIVIDQDLIDAAGLLVYEQVDVLNINNGARFTTYVIAGKRGSGTIGIMGAAARLVQKGDLVIICAYGQVPAEDAETVKPTVLLMDENNAVKEIVKG